MFQEKTKSNFQDQEGSVRLYVALIVVTICLMWAGGQKIYTALGNRKPAVMSYSEYARTKPSASWLVLTNCKLDIPHTCYLTKNGATEAYYIPVFDPDAPKEKAYVLYKTTDPSISAILKEMDGLKTDDEIRTWLKANMNRVFPRRDVSGLVAFGIESSDNRQELERVQENMADHFVILNANAQPSLAVGIGFMGAGLGILCAMVLVVRQKRS